MITLQHNQVTTYQDFVDRLIERFDKKNHEVYFQELAPLRQLGGLEQFINDFQKLALMVPNISEWRLAILFTLRLTKPLKGWVKAFDPPTLQEAMKKAISILMRHNLEHHDEDPDEAKGEQEADSVEKKEASKLHLEEIRLSSIQREGSFRLRGVLAGQKVITLLDTCAIHNFIDARFVERHGLITEEFEGLRVKVPDGYTLCYDRMVQDLPLCLKNYDFKVDYHVVNMGDMT